MRRSFYGVMLASALALLVGCGDDGGTTTDTSGGDTTVTDTTVADTMVTDTVADTTVTDTVADTTITDTVADTTVTDTVADTTETDTTVADTTETDTTVTDTTVTDTTVADTTVTDTTTDTTVADTTETDTTAPGCATELFFSEYVEGASSDKALEIANFTGFPVDVGEYAIIDLRNADGVKTWDTDGTVIDLPHHVLESGDVYVICNAAASAEIKSQCDLVLGDSGGAIDPTIVYFNGNDARSLAKGGVRIDDIGSEADPGSTGWTVAGVADATVDHTLVRKSTVMTPTTDWATSSADEWTVLDIGTITDLGQHTYDGSCPATTAAADIVINEIVAAPAGDGKDWIELYNNTAAAVDLGGWTLDDTGSVDGSETYTFPAGTMIPADGFLVLDRDADFTFGLGADDAVVLRDDAGVYADAVSWLDGFAPEGSSYGRLPDGTGDFQTLTLTTPDAPNATCGDAVCQDGESCGACAADCGACADVALNEVLWASSDTTTPFVELYNLQATEADISGWSLVVGDASYVFPAATTIAAGAYLVVDATNHGLTLAASDAMSLADDGGFILETATWDSLSAGDSWGRVPNGNGSFTTLNAPSPGAENQGTAACATDLFISEYVEGGSYNKALEIANFTGAAVDLSGYAILSGSNGAAFSDTYALTGTLANGDVLVLCHGSIDAAYLDRCDVAITSTVVNFNGDDARALAKVPTGGGSPVVIDAFGLTTGDPGDGWSVGDVTAATKDHTFRRMSSVLSPNADWTASSVSEWEILAKDTLDGLGSHAYGGTCP